MTAAPPRLLSVGYEGRTAADLVQLLVDERVDVLVDVRLTPLSRKPGLSRTRLAAALEAAGIRYVHARALGNPKDNREPFRTGDVAAGAARMRALLRHPDAVAAVDLVAEYSAGEDRRVALLCFEREHDRCHRAVVADVVRERAAGLELAQL